MAVGAIVKIESEKRPNIPLRVVGLQIVATLATAVLALIWGLDMAKAVFLGGMAAFLPNACFAGVLARCGRGAPERAAQHGAILAGGRLLGQWIAKVALTVALLALLIVEAEVVGLGFFIGLSVALLAPLAAPLVSER